MKGYVRIVLVATLLLLSTALLAGLTISPLWPSGNTWKVQGKAGPGLITNTGGNLLFLSNDGALYKLDMSGKQTSLGQMSGVANIVMPPTYASVNGKNYVVYATAQGTPGNKIVVHKVGTSSSDSVTSKTDITSSSYGVVVQEMPSATSLIIYAGTMDKKVYKVTFDATGDTFGVPQASVNIDGPVKAPPILSMSKTNLYVLTQNGIFYSINTTNFDAAHTEIKLELHDEFTVPMAMDETGYIYALGLSGTLYKIDPSAETQVSGKFLTGCDSAGVLIDGDGYVYGFGGGKVVVVNMGLAKVADYTIGGKITTTPAIVKGRDGTTYVIVPSSMDGYSGKITILSFDHVFGSLSKVWEYPSSSNLDSFFPISAAVSISSLGSLTEDNYYFATATNDGTVYAWQLNATGPFGVWAMYGQNTKHTGFIDAGAISPSKIFIKALEGYSGKELSSTLVKNANNYGLAYDATLVKPGAAPVSKGEKRTNESNLSDVVQGTPGDKLEVKFATKTSLSLLFNGIQSEMKVSPPSTDSDFYFKFWQTGVNGYEGNPTDNPATLTYRFTDRTVYLYTDAAYRYLVYHKYPLSEPDASFTETIPATFDYSAFISNPSNAKITIPASTTYKGHQWNPFKWVVYQWNPDKSLGYDKTTFGSREEITLPLKGPAYIEIYYAELSATITLMLPEFAYGRTQAYLFLDAATNSVAYTMEATALNGVTIEKIVPEYARDIVPLEETFSSSPSHLKYVFKNLAMDTPLETETRVATLALNLFFPEKTEFSNSHPDEYFEDYFNMYGYAQIQGQLIDSQTLSAKKSYATDKYLYIAGDFTGDFDVDIEDWNFFSQKYGTTVSGTEVIYNIGPREGFMPPYPDISNYKAGFLIDTTNRVNEEDLYVFTSMFGFAKQ